MTTCTHVDQIREVTPEADGCVECLAIGDEWVHLRLCMTCGHVGCCESSRGRHATAHARATNHPIVELKRPGFDGGSRAWKGRGHDQFEEVPT